MKKKTLIDGRGHIIGYQSKDLTLDRRGRIVARYNKSSDRTLDQRGRIIGVGVWAGRNPASETKTAAHWL